MTSTSDDERIKKRLQCALVETMLELLGDEPLMNLLYYWRVERHHEIDAKPVFDRLMNHLVWQAHWIDLRGSWLLPLEESEWTLSKVAALLKHYQSHDNFQFYATKWFDLSRVHQIAIITRCPENLELIKASSEVAYHHLKFEYSDLSCGFEKALQQSGPCSSNNDNSFLEELRLSDGVFYVLDPNWLCGDWEQVRDDIAALKERLLSHQVLFLLAKMPGDDDQPPLQALMVLRREIGLRIPCDIPCRIALLFKVGDGYINWSSLLDSFLTMLYSKERCEKMPAIELEADHFVTTD